MRHDLHLSPDVAAIVSDGQRRRQKAIRQAAPARVRRVSLRLDCEPWLKDLSARIARERETSISQLCDFLIAVGLRAYLASDPTLLAELDAATYDAQSLQFRKGLSLDDLRAALEMAATKTETGLVCALFDPQRVRIGADTDADVSADTDADVSADTDADGQNAGAPFSAGAWTLECAPVSTAQRESRRTK